MKRNIKFFTLDVIENDEVNVPRNHAVHIII